MSDAAPPVDDRLTLHDVAGRLGVHYMTAYRYVRTGRLPASKVGGTWWVAEADLRAFTSDGTTTPGTTPTDPTDHARRLEDRLVHGDEAGAWVVLEEAMASWSSPTGVYTDLLSPAMSSIGEKWAAGSLQIEEEHLASSIVQRLIGRLGPRLTRRGRRRGTVVIGAPAGDDHGIPLLLVGDLLRARGFDVVDLGANTPPAAFARAVASVDDLVGVGICATRPDNDSAVVEAVHALASGGGVDVVLGGYGVGEHTLDLVERQSAGAVRLSASTQDAIDRFEEIAATRPAVSLPDPGGPGDE